MYDSCILIVQQDFGFIILRVEISRSVRRWSLRTTARKTGILNDDENNKVLSTVGACAPQFRNVVKTQISLCSPFD